jgi:hypothetical protein
MAEDTRAQSVETIMAEVHQSLEQRRQAGELQEPDWGRYQAWDGAPDELAQSLKELNTRWNQVYEPAMTVTSRIPLVGRLWTALRRQVHAEVRSYLDPMIYRQVELNAAVVRSLNVLSSGLYGGSLPRSLQAVYQEVVALRERVQYLEERMCEMEKAAGRPAPQEPTP